MRSCGGLFVAVALVGISLPAFAQAPPPGSYQGSCGEIRMHGTTLSATCRREDGRAQQSSLDIAHCAGNIENRNGRLKCNRGAAGMLLPGGRPPAYVGPGYPAPGYSPGYPPSGYPAPRYGEEGGHRERCGSLEHRAHELHERLEHTPYGEDRERLEHRLREIDYQREECWHH